MWFSVFAIAFPVIFACICLHRIADALETHNRWQAKMSADLATIREILNIKRG